MSGQPVVVWGESDFLVREVATAALAGVEAVEVDGREWRSGLTADLATPSMFGESRGLLVVNAQHLDPAALAEIRRYTAQPAPGSSLVMAVTVSPRAKGPAKALLAAAGRGARVQRAAVERRDLPRWVVDRARARGMPATGEGAVALISALGEDPAVLHQAVEQLAAARFEEGVTTETVNAQFRGFGEHRTWELCDSAFGRDLHASMRILVGMLDAGEEPLAILGGIASRLRDLLRIRALPPRTPPAELARAAGLRFDWQARRYRDQSHRFEPGELEAVHERLVEADRLLKQGSTGEVVLPMVVAAIAGATPARAASAP